MICFAKLPLAIPITEIQNEINGIKQSWYPHLNLHDYQGRWEIISLRSPGGMISNINPDGNEDIEFTDTPLMNICPSIKQITTELQCPIMAVRLLNLKGGAKIKPHKDYDLAFEKGEARIHIPIFTNHLVKFYVEENLIKMHEGTCWYINANLEHRISNNGVTDRIHLVIDCRVSDNIINLFDKADKTIRDEDYNVTEKLLVIETLRQHNSATSSKLADDLEIEINTYLSNK